MTDSTPMTVRTHHSGVSEICCTSCNVGIGYVNDSRVLKNIGTADLISEINRRYLAGDSEVSTFMNNVLNSTSRKRSASVDGTQR